GTSRALGKRITISGAPGRVVGVVGDVHDESLDVPPEMFVYKPMLDSVGGGARAMTLVLRSDRDPLALVPAVRETLASVDPDVPISDVRTLEDIVADSLSRTTFTMVLMVLATVIALLLGSVGIYGVMSYVVIQRTAEIAIRLVLGARPATVRSMVIRQGMTVAGYGIAIGLAAAAALGRVMASLLYGLSPWDPVTFVVGPVVFVAVAWLATNLPARTAASTRLVEALRRE
ncbi:MAG TPA: FtsX-like permease family protein, partial [Longimicrobiales bacterium]|nr:FtsX-like permease family protein [Longimicrobiales bacterium]